MLLRFIPLILSTSVLTDSIKFDCHPDKVPTESNCVRRGCQWLGSKDSAPWRWDRPGPPVCRFPDDNTHGYALRSPGHLPLRLQRRSSPSLFGDDAEALSLDAHDIAGGLHLFLRPSAATAETEAARNKSSTDQATSGPECSHRSDNLCVRVSPDPKSSSPVSISRSRWASPLLSLFTAPLVVSEQYLQISFQLSSSYLYGFGEQYHETLRRAFDWRKLSALNHDTPPRPESNNLYGSHPFLLAYDAGGLCFGLFFDNNYPMDLQLQPGNVITFRTMGGQGDFYIFNGPTPMAVVQQYVRMIGPPRLPPMWFLGFQLSRYGYKDTEAIARVWKRNRDAGIPQDVQYADIDYMDKHRDFTYGDKFKDLPGFVENVIHKSGRKFMPILDPGISSEAKGYPALQSGLAMDVFVKGSRDRKPTTGVVWPGRTFFPDFTHPNATPWWAAQLKDFRSQLPFDGIWLDMNDPSNFAMGSVTGCSLNGVNYPPYAPTAYWPVFTRTLCFDAQHHSGAHVLWHNRYGTLESEATYGALAELRPGQRPAVLSRSTSPGSGRWTAHWTGDISSTWRALNQSLVGQLEFGMFGISVVGADICGFMLEATEELCLRWSQVGAFYSFSRNHNDNLVQRDQDPAAWSKETTAAIRRVLMLRAFRYQFLPVLYTALRDAELNASQAVRPLFFEFPSDLQVRDLSSQFLWGASLMIVPILGPEQVARAAYFPQGLWYRLDSGPAMEATAGPKEVLVPVGRETIGLFQRGGSVLFGQLPAETTAEAARKPLLVYVAPDGNGEAEGEVFLDSGDGLQYRPGPKSVFTILRGKCERSPGKQAELRIAKEHGASPAAQRLVARVTFGGLRHEPSAVIANGRTLSRKNWTWLPQSNSCTVHFDPPLDLTAVDVV